MKVIITFTFCYDNLWKSKFMALEKPGKLREFFSPTLWPRCSCCFMRCRNQCFVECARELCITVLVICKCSRNLLSGVNITNCELKSTGYSALPSAKANSVATHTQYTRTVWCRVSQYLCSLSGGVGNSTSTHYCWCYCCCCCCCCYC